MGVFVAFKKIACFKANLHKSNGRPNRLCLLRLGRNPLFLTYSLNSLLIYFDIIDVFIYVVAMSKMPPELKTDRFRKIVSIVNSNQRVSLADLERQLGASRITVQRDLVELESRSLLRRFHGGAMSIEYSEELYDPDVKKTVNVTAKKRIAAKAAELVKEGFYIGLDSSSTVYYLSEALFAGQVLVLACGVDSYKNLSSRGDIELVLAGGRLNKKTNTLSGYEMVSTIRRFQFDLVFISADSFTADRGFFVAHPGEIEVKRALIESSKKTAMLMDASKICEANGTKVCDVDEVDFVITDSPNRPDLKKVFRDRLM